MSVVIVGGNECMECRYKQICKQYGHKAKVFVKEKGNWVRKMGLPELFHIKWYIMLLRKQKGIT